MHDFRHMANTRLASGQDDPDIRILRRVTPLETLPLAPRGDGPFRQVIVLDCETTGTDPAVDEIIDLAIVRLEVDATGEIVDVLSKGEALCDPGVLIPAAIQKLTGITDEMVAGKTIDLDKLERRLKGASLLIAHNCAFVENLVPSIVVASWACSANEIDWPGLGWEGKKLGHLLMQAGFFSEVHRAMADVVSLINLLSHRLPDGSTPMRHLLAAADRTTIRFDATGAPYEKRSMLKSAGYRWDPRHRVWWCQIQEERCAEEERWFRQHIAPHGPTPRMISMTSRERHR